MKITKTQIRKIISEVIEKAYDPMGDADVPVVRTDSRSGSPKKWSKWEQEAFETGLINYDGTSTKLGQLLRRIARYSPAGYDATRKEVEPLIDAGYVTYGLTGGGYRAHITDIGRQLLQFF